MVPINKQILPLRKLAEYSARQTDEVRMCAELHAELLAAFWRAELAAVFDDCPRVVDRDRLLQSIARERAHPGFTLVESPELAPAPLTQRADGGGEIDLRRYIALPADPAHWTPSIVEAACAQLAEMSVEDFSDLIRPIIYDLGATRKDFGDYCDRVGWPRPAFWFGREPGKAWPRGRRHEAKAWLARVASEPKQKEKAAYFADAKKRFPGLSYREFDRLWGEVVPQNWKKSGPVQRGARRSRK